jgi:putative oxidoreductase
MLERLAPYADRAYALFRIVLGFAFSLHGMQKLFGWLGGTRVTTDQPLLLAAGIIELVCGVLVALGLFARPAAFLASGEMAYAYITQHWKLRFDSGFFPIVNHGEPALIYCFAFLFVACRGAGPWSLDRERRRAAP